MSIAPSPVDRRRGRRSRIGAALVMLAAAVVVAALLLHRAVPGSAGSVLDSGLPWLGLAVPVLALGAAVLRSRVAGVVVAAPALVWSLMFGPVLLPRAAADHHDLRVATLNLGAAEPAAALRPLLSAGADLVILQEITPGNREAVAGLLDPGYRYRAAAGTVGVWSRLPLSATGPVDIGIGWVRALRTTVTLPGGHAVRVYAAHLASARPDATAERDRTVGTLARTVAADPSTRLLVVGDLNTTTTDRRFAAFAPLHDTQEEGGAGFGFTWPSALPVMRPDHILQRGMSTERSWVVSAPGSDHRAALADLQSTVADPPADQADRFR